MSANEWILLMAGAALFALPFAPALLEMLRETDFAPAPIPERLAADPREGGEQVFWYLAARLGLGSPKALEGFMRGLRKGAAHPSSTLLLEAGAELPSSVAESQVLAQGPLRASPGSRLKSKLVSMTSLETGESSLVLEAHALGRLEIGDRNRVLWWASGSEVAVGEGCELKGKVSAAERLTVRPGTSFNILESKVVELGGIELEEAVYQYVTEPFQGDLPGTIHRGERSSRTVVAGDVEIPELAEWNGDLIVRGNLVVGEGAVIRGSVKASRDIVLGRGSKVLGSVFSEGSIRMERGARAQGPVAAEEVVSLSEGTRIGSPSSQTTLIAQMIEVLGPCRAHGTVRAWSRGTVGRGPELRA